MAAEGFQLNDVVDAFHNDGWWKGVVSHVAEGGEKLSVKFNNQPDEVVFGPSELHAQWDWVDGVWIGPKKQGGIVFEVEMKVEAWFLRSDDVDGAWYPGTFVKDLENGLFPVELKYNDGDCVRCDVDRFHVRPCPPIIKDWDFHMSERVDVFRNFGWWSGSIREKNGHIFLVFLDQMGSARVFQQWDLRPRMHWKDGNWCIGFDNHRAAPSSNIKRRVFSCVSDSISALEMPANRETENNGAQVEDDAENGVSFEEDVERFACMVDEYDTNSETSRDSDLVDKGELQRLCFVMRNEIWKNFESMDVFKKIPHFKPLEEFKESQREGLAIACMVTFTNVVESICRKDPKCPVDDINETLLDLDAHGFDVGMVRELMASKEKLVHKAKDLDDQILEH